MATTQKHISLQKALKEVQRALRTSQYSKHATQALLGSPSFTQQVKRLFGQSKLLSFKEETAYLELPTATALEAQSLAEDLEQAHLSLPKHQEDVSRYIQIMNLDSKEGEEAFEGNVFNATLNAAYRESNPHSTLDDSRHPEKSSKPPIRQVLNHMRGNLQLLIGEYEDQLSSPDLKKAQEALKVSNALCAILSPDYHFKIRNSIHAIQQQYLDKFQEMSADEALCANWALDNTRQNLRAKLANLNNSNASQRHLIAAKIQQELDTVENLQDTLEGLQTLLIKNQTDITLARRVNHLTNDVCSLATAVKQQVINNKEFTEDIAGAQAKKYVQQLHRLTNYFMQNNPNKQSHTNPKVMSGQSKENPSPHVTTNPIYAEVTTVQRKKGTYHVSPNMQKGISSTPSGIQHTTIAAPARLGGPKKRQGKGALPSILAQRMITQGGLRQRQGRKVLPSIPEQRMITQNANLGRAMQRPGNRPPAQDEIWNPLHEKPTNMQRRSKCYNLALQKRAEAACNGTNNTPFAINLRDLSNPAPYLELLETNTSHTENRVHQWAKDATQTTMEELKREGRKKQSQGTVPGM